MLYRRRLLRVAPIDFLRAFAIAFVVLLGVATTASIWTSARQSPEPTRPSAQLPSR